MTAREREVKRIVEAAMDAWRNNPGYEAQGRVTAEYVANLLLDRIDVLTQETSREREVK